MSTPRPQTSRRRSKKKQGGKCAVVGFGLLALYALAVCSGLFRVFSSYHNMQGPREVYYHHSNRHHHRVRKRSREPPTDAAMKEFNGDRHNHVSSSSSIHQSSSDYYSASDEYTKDSTETKMDVVEESPSEDDVGDEVAEVVDGSGVDDASYEPAVLKDQSLSSDVTNIVKESEGRSV